MATLERLRKHSGLLLAVVVGMALIAFVLGDFLRSSGRIFRQSKRTIAEVNGEGIPIQQYRKRVDQLTAFYKQQRQAQALKSNTMYEIRDRVWKQMIQSSVLSEEYEQLGIDVSEDELFELVQGRNPHPLVKRYFSDAEGKFNRRQLLDFISQMDGNRVKPQQKKFWLYLEDQIVRQQKISKFNNLVTKGLYVTGYEAKRNFKEKQRQVDANYTVKSYNNIPDSKIQVAEADLKSYYEAHPQKYQQETSRDLKFVALDIAPSSEDDSVARAWIHKIKPEFEKVEDENLKQFVNVNSDTAFDDQYYKKSDLRDTLQEFMFNAEVGDIMGPYFENGTYKLARLANIKDLPDSVKIRHIVLPIQRQQNNRRRGGGQSNLKQVQAKADSLMEELKAGADFASVARQHSKDPRTADEGGVMGWVTPQELPSPMDDSCFFNEPGDIMKLRTNRGVHIIEIMDQSEKVKQVQIARVKREVVPSNETYRGIYEKAKKFAGEIQNLSEFKEAADQYGLIIREADSLKPNDRKIPGIGNAREVVKWAYEAKENDVSEAFEIRQDFVIAALENIRKEGVAPFKTVKERIERRVMKNKKYDYVQSQLKGVPQDNLAKIAETLQTPIDKVEDVRFQSFSLGGIGMEPKVLAGIASLNKGEVSIPMKGNSGVFISKALRVDEPSVPSNTKRLQQSLLYQQTSRAGKRAYEALKESANIQDNRARFY